MSSYCDILDNSLNLTMYYLEGSAWGGIIRFSPGRLFDWFQVPASPLLKIKPMTLDENFRIQLCSCFEWKSCMARFLTSVRIPFVAKSWMIIYYLLLIFDRKSVDGTGQTRRGSEKKKKKRNWNQGLKADTVFKFRRLSFLPAGYLIPKGKGYKAVRSRIWLPYFSL